MVLLQNKQQEQQRQNYELSESQRRQQLEEQARALSAQEREARINKARQLSEKALAAYENKEYGEATRLFKAAIELDPENNKNYFQYGVSLFQQKEYQKSLVALNMAEDGDFSRVDKNYFIGMNHFRMNENEKALKNFIDVRDQDDANVSPTASFYAGVLQYNTTQYKDAKVSFNYVLDRSQDPQMDAAAEGYLEKIDAIEQFEAQSKERWVYSLYAGALYDSNVLNVAAANAPTDIAGLRAMYGASLERRLIYDYFTEWSIGANVSDMYTTTTGLSPKEELQNADPLVAGLKAPYKIKTSLADKAYTLTLTPGLETIYMNADASGPRENINNSYYLNIDNSFVHRSDWIGVYTLDYRNDASLLSVPAVDDQSANKYTLSTSQVFIADAKAAKSYIVDLAYIMNVALGDNQKYNRINLGLTYSWAYHWGFQTAARLDYGDAAYTDSTAGRKDNNYGLTLSASKSLSKKWSTALSLGWSQNTSSLEVYSYDKISLSNVYTYSGAF